MSADSSRSAFTSDQEGTPIDSAQPETNFPMVWLDDVLCPQIPTDVEQTGIDRQIHLDLLMRLGLQIPTFTTDWVANQTQLPMQMVEALLWELKQDQLLEVMGQVGPFNYRYSLTQRGSDYATKASNFSGYVGPAPVSLEDYTQFLTLQQQQRPRITPEAVRDAFRDLVLPAQSVQVAGLAAASFRSLFLFGPPGNGKTSLGRSLHRVNEGGIWIPYCLCIEHHIVRIFDPQVHHLLPTPAGAYDRRWVYIQRPFIVVGGELAMSDLDLSFNPTVRYYEAPSHLKANGGTFLVDDFGRQRMNPTDLLNRWIIPLEHQIDFLTLHTGQRIQVPFHLMLIVATNLALSQIADEAFLRRMGYRLQLSGPDQAAYVEILTRYLQQIGATMDPTVPAYLLERYQQEKRVLRASEPRDLLERARDYCHYESRPLHIDRDVIDVAWDGYFGTPITS
jgi:predicted ATPase with chaperone activity